MRIIEAKLDQILALLLNPSTASAADVHAVRERMDTLVTSIGGEEQLAKLKGVDFDTVVYVCDAMTTYRTRGVRHFLTSIKAIR